MVIRIKKVSTDDAVDILYHAVGLERFHPTEESRQAVHDLALAAHVRVSLIERHPRVQVAARSGTVYVTLEGATAHEEKEIPHVAGQIPGVQRVEVNARPFLTPD
jgi:hypothetical protein